MTERGQLVRNQHPGFGAELRDLFRSPRKENKRIAGVVDSEMKRLQACKSRGQAHPDEDRLEGDKLREIGYLQLYGFGFSIRIYFHVDRGVLWMLGIDVAKRRTNLTTGTKTALLKRLEEVVPS